jgi:hypothetical protein
LMNMDTSCARDEMGSKPTWAQVSSGVPSLTNIWGKKVSVERH